MICSFSFVSNLLQISCWLYAYVPPFVDVIISSMPRLARPKATERRDNVGIDKITALSEPCQQAIAASIRSVLEIHLRVDYDMPTCQRLFNVLDLDDAAFRLRVLWILHHRYVQFIFVFAKRDVRGAIPGGNFEDVK